MELLPTVALRGELGRASRRICQVQVRCKTLCLNRVKGRLAVQPEATPQVVLPFLVILSHDGL